MALGGVGAVTGATSASAQASLTPFKTIDLPPGEHLEAIEPGSGWLFTLGQDDLTMFSPNGFYGGKLTTTPGTWLIDDGQQLFVGEPGQNRVSAYDSSGNDPLIYSLAGFQPTGGVKVGSALWLTTSTSILKLDLSSGAVTNYTTWGGAKLTPVAGGTYVVANAYPNAYVLDMATDPPTASAPVALTEPTTFTTDPRGGQVFGSKTAGGGTTTVYAVPGLTATAQSYTPPNGAPDGSAPDLTVLDGGWLAKSFGANPATVALYRAGTAATAPTATFTVAGSVDRVVWRPLDATLIVARQDPQLNGTAQLLYYAIAGPTAPTGNYGDFTPVTPYRVFDTRSGTQENPRVGALGPGEAVDVQIAGTGRVAAADISAVALNITVVGPSAPTFVSVYPADGGLPPVSNVNATPGQLKVNSAFVRVGANGAIRVYNDQGSTPVIIDVLGYFSTRTGPLGARFHPTDPTRLLDTRHSGPVPGGGALTLGLAGAAVPANAKAVLLNVTVVNPSAANYVVVYPAGEPMPLASNVNAFPGQTVPNLVLAKIGSNGQIIIANNGGTAHLVVDISGWWDDDHSTNAGRFLPEFQPIRWSDTRHSSGPLPDNYYLSFRFGNFPIETPELPSHLGGTGTIVANTTVIAIDGGGFGVVYPGELGPNRPYASNLNFAPGETVANLTVTRLGTNDRINFDAEGSTTHVIMDLQGLFTNEHY